MSPTTPALQASGASAPELTVELEEHARAVVYSDMDLRRGGWDLLVGRGVPTASALASDFVSASGSELLMDDGTRARERGA